MSRGERLPGIFPTRAGGRAFAGLLRAEGYRVETRMRQDGAFQAWMLSAPADVTVAQHEATLQRLLAVPS